MTLPVPTQMGIPLMGLDRKDALANMDASYSPWAVNWLFEQQSMRVRPGFKIHCTPDADGPLVLGLGTYGVPGSSTSKLFAYCMDGGTPSSNHLIYDISTSTPSLVHTAAGKNADEVYPAYYAGRLALMTETNFDNESRVYNGSTWAAWGFTNAGGSAAVGGRTVVTYKNRVYIFTGTKVHYSSTVGGITGTTVEVDFATIFTGGGNIAWASVFSSPGDNINQIMLAFGTSDGEILVYQGDYPGSDTWSIAARFQISPVLGYNSILVYRNDTWIFTRTGIVSLRDLFTKGNEGAQAESVSAAINPLWTALVESFGAAIGSTEVSGAYWPEQNKIFILCPGYVKEDGTMDNEYSTLFVYNTITQSWSMLTFYHVDATFWPRALTYYKNNIYIAIRGLVVTLSTVAYKDEIITAPTTYQAYEIPLKGAFSNFGRPNRSKFAKGFEPIIKTGFSGTSFGMKAIADFNRRTSARASVPLVSGYNIPFYGCGVEGNYVQYAFDGNSDVAATSGLEVFAVGAVVAP